MAGFWYWQALSARKFRRNGRDGFIATAVKLNASLISFINAQPFFFVATAAPEGRVNVSPKGLDSLRVLSESEIVWLNLSGSGNETAAHLREHPRMTLMFCAFDAEARIVRVYGKATTLHPGDAEWDRFIIHFPAMAGSRQIFLLEIDLVQTSCGSGVPVMQYVKQRGPDEMLPFYDKMGPDGVRDYWKRRNALSIEGKPTGIMHDTSILPAPCGEGDCRASTTFPAS